VWLDTLALGRLSVHCELNVSVCELNEKSAVGSSSMRSLVLLESLRAFAEWAVAVSLCELVSQQVLGCFLALLCSAWDADSWAGRLQYRAARLV